MYYLGFRGRGGSLPASVKPFQCPWKGIAPVGRLDTYPPPTVGAGTVSNTHLGAHETKGKPECRLRLEKKKKKKEQDGMKEQK